LLIIAVVVVAPWEVRNQRAFHTFVPLSTVDGFILAGVYNGVTAHDHIYPAEWRPPIYLPMAAPLFKDRRLDELALSKALRRQAITYATDHPSYVPRAVFWNTARLFNVAGLSAVRNDTRSLGYGGGWTIAWFLSYCAVGLLAVGGAFTRRARSAPLPIWLTPALFAVVTVPTLGTTRYRAPLEPFLVLLASLAATALLDRRRPSVPTSTPW
jgi:hypothetical protein